MKGRETQRRARNVEALADDYPYRQTLGSTTTIAIIGILYPPPASMDARAVRRKRVRISSWSTAARDDHKIGGWRAFMSAAAPVARGGRCAVTAHYS